MWALVDNQGQITEYNRLPKSWQHVSNLFALEDQPDKLAALGWYKVVDVSDPLPNMDTHEYGDAQLWLNVSQSRVEKSHVVREKSHVNQTTQEQFLQLRADFMMQLRMARDEKLRESDWTQMLDVQQIKGEDWRVSWATYRQWLRDVTSLYNEAPFDHITNITQVQWPPTP